MASFRLGGEEHSRASTGGGAGGAGSRYGGGDSGSVAFTEVLQPSARELPGVAVSETPSSCNVILSV